MILTPFEITTYGIDGDDGESGGDFLTLEDYILINGKEIDNIESYTERKEDKLTYMKRTWIDSGRDIIRDKDKYVNNNENLYNDVLEFMEEWFSEFINKSSYDSDINNESKVILKYETFRNNIYNNKK